MRNWAQILAYDLSAPRFLDQEVRPIVLESSGHAVNALANSSSLPWQLYLCAYE